MFSYVEKQANGDILNVTTSVEHPDCPEVSGVVRAQAGVAGQWLQNHPTQEGKTLVTQIADIDPMGSLPKAIVKMVTETVLPGRYILFNDKILTFVYDM